MAERQQATIVVIDDHPDYLRYIVTLLERAGYEVAGFLDAESALASVERVPPRLVVTDIFMPGLDGFEVLRRLRQVEPPIPVVAMSGMISGHDTLYLDSMKMLGAVAVFTKPIVGRELLAAVEGALRDQTPTTG
jgi:CheY-like chemotaxis protein